MRKVLLTAVASALLFSSTSALASQAFHDTSATTMRSAAFIGARVRLGLDSAKSLRPVARLAAGTTHVALDSRWGQSEALTSSTVELGISSVGKADFYMAGQRLSDIQHRLGIAPAAVGLLALGGLALAVGAGGSALSQDTAKAKEKREVVCLGIGICPP